ncbi:MAG TPA: vitamin K epoxide reductase family protein [Gemmatimonadales bacterium]|nr:vitamin K epoxide reductase family protein [Gemmatimonadales bacterium]
MSAALTALAGVFISAYLWLYKLGKIGTLTCGTGGCETVQLSPYSRFLGLEVAAIGAVGYALLLVLSLASLNARPALAARLITALVVLSGMALLFTLYLKYLELFVIHAICRWCVASAVLILVFFVLVVLERRRIGRPLA